MAEKRGFVGYWIPAELALDHRLSWAEKVLYCEIMQLHAGGECRASNKHFAEHLGVSDRQVRTYLAKLESLGLVTKLQTETKRILTPNGGSKVPQGRKQTSGGAEADFRSGAEESFHRNEKVKRETKRDRKRGRTVERFDHPKHHVPCGKTQYETLCSEYSKKTTEDYIERVVDYCTSKDKSYADYAAAAHNWMKRDGVKRKAEMYDHEIPGSRDFTYV